MKGFAKLHMSARETVWHDPLLMRVYTYCLFEKTYKKTTARLTQGTVELHEDQLITGRNKLAEAVAGEGYAKSEALVIWRKLEKLEKLGFVKLQKVKRSYTVVTVMDPDRESNKEVERLPEKKEAKAPEQPQKPTEDKAEGMDAVMLYQQNIGILSPLATQEIIMWAEDFSEEIVCEAIKRAAKDNKTWSYAEGILKRWANANVKSLEDIKGLDLQHERSKQTKRSFNQKPARKEQLPEWFENRHQQNYQEEAGEDFEAKKLAYLERRKRKKQEGM
ncbi:DnaD domain-containing protein [Jeotgalibacillus campisalis]|uniref:DnaD domain-containing protein n=1 Tax=Jeotgalibacillus campisalis TaxID=220754 RepID=UPI001E2CA9C8|nr:DnaD domain protein [Jeotgalibacillus campisalis]